jgi:hypothetical protein
MTLSSSGTAESVSRNGRLARIFFMHIGLVALLPLVLGRETFTSDTVWLRIVRGELDGAQALQEGLYRAEGDFSLLVKMGEWFPRRG